MPGFTLIELLVVIAIVALLVALLLPALERARAAAHNVMCQSQLRQLSAAVFQYQNDNRGRYPVIARKKTSPSKFWYTDYIAPYFENPEGLRCPADERSAPAKPTYAPNMVGAGAIETLSLNGWGGIQPVNEGGRVRVYEVEKSGALNKQEGLFNGDVDDSGDPFRDNPYMVEQVGIHGIPKVTSANPPHTGSMQFLHPERAMNYLTATLAVRHGEFAGIPEPDLKKRAYGIGGAGSWRFILVGHKPKNKLPQWPYETLASEGAPHFARTGER